MADLGFWNFARRDPEQLALVDPDGREWTRGELLAGRARRPLSVRQRRALHRVIAKAEFLARRH